MTIGWPLLASRRVSHLVAAGSRFLRLGRPAGVTQLPNRYSAAEEAPCFRDRWPLTIRTRDV